MFLKKCIYINWGNIPNSEFEFGPINLLSGGNGSGKTTAADAIQTIMTAAHDYLFTYNPGQDETTQRGRGGKLVRTLSSYALGCDDGSYARVNTSDSYIAACFHPTTGETALPFTAIICTRAHLDRAGAVPVARQDELFFLILPQAELCITDLQKETPEKRRHVVPLEMIVGQLRKDYEVEKYDTKKAYLKRLYGILRGKDLEVPEREAMNAARAFSRFMAYKPVKSINDFVASEVLEKRDLGDAIRSVSDLLKTIHGMESDARRLKGAIDVLHKSAAYGESYISCWIELNIWQYIAARHAFLRDQSEYLGVKKTQKALQDEQVLNQQERETLEARLAQVETSLLELTAKRMGHQPLQQKDQLEKLVVSHGHLLQEQAPKLLQQNHSLERSLQATSELLSLMKDPSLGAELSSLLPADLLRVGRAFEKVKEKANVSLSSLLGRDWVDISPLENQLDDAFSIQKQASHWYALLHDAELSAEGISLRDQLARHLHKRESHNTRLAQQKALKQAEIESLETRQVAYPSAVRIALEAIKKEYPEAAPQVLCDYVEIIDTQWQNAIEGYIGGARFSLIVEPEYEARAIRLLRDIKGGSSARVIQGAKAQKDSARITLPANSIIHGMKFTHATARHYLTASYGNVERVDSEEELRFTRRGITRHGLGSGAYSLWRCDTADADLVFGLQAREKALSAKQQELLALQVEHQSAHDIWQQIKHVLQSIDQVKLSTYADRLKAMLDVHRELRDAEQKLAQLDLKDFTQLESELDALRLKDKTIRGQVHTLIERKGRLATELEQVVQRCLLLSKQKDLSEAHQTENEENIRSIVSVWPDFDPSARLADADERANDIRAEQLSLAMQEVSADIDSLAHQFESALLEHNQHSPTADQIAYLPDYTEKHKPVFFSRICAVCRDIDLVHNRLKNNILVEKKEKLNQLKDTFNNTFVTHLCHSIYQSINDGKRILDELNAELQHHRFGADRESFRFAYTWVPEFKEYWSFFKEVIALPNLGDGATLFDAELSAKGQKVRDRLIAMLLSDDEVKSVRELDRISDFRNYRHYEIFKEPEGKQPIALSQYGTGSGGQLETPAYIIRAAAITSAFRFNEGDSHLRMVLVDEAFSKMDETRSREVISYLTETLGLQILFIMPTSKSGPFMDLISNQFVFTKCPTTAPVGELNTRVLVDRQTCNRDKIKELWANHRRQVRHQFALDFMEEFI